MTAISHVVVSLLLLWLGAQPAAKLAAQHPRELTNRNEWQRPKWVMDVLGVREGSVVADVGAGSGYFTLHVAGRVGPSGRVYAVELREDALAGIRALAEALGLPQIRTVLGKPGDPQLPPETFNVVLVVNAYHEMAEHDAMMASFLKALKPGGLVGIIDAEGPPGSTRASYVELHQLPTGLVQEDARRHGFEFVGSEPGFVNPDNGETWFFLVFRRPAAAER